MYFGQICMYSTCKFIHIITKDDIKCPFEAVSGAIAKSFFSHDYPPRPSWQIILREFKNRQKMHEN